MAFRIKLRETFYEDLKKLSLFEEAVTLVKETYKLEIDVNKSRMEFVIRADGSEILDFVENLLESWLERKKKKQSDKLEDRIEMTKENPLSDIFDGHVVWVFWGDLASKLSSGKGRKEVEKLRLVQESQVSVQYEKPGRLSISCNIKTFKDMKPKVEKLKLLVASGRHDHYGNLQIIYSDDISHTDGTKGQNGEDKAIKRSDDSDASKFKACGDNQIKSVKSETSTDNNKSLKQNTLRLLEGASGGKNWPPNLRGSHNGSDQSSHSSGSEEENVDDKLLFCTPSGRIKVFVYEASIVSLSGIDAIVNAANEDLKHIGGVAYHISKAAGGDKSALEIECCNYVKKKKKVSVTKNFTSSAGKMPYKGVIHAVGPMWSDYDVKEECAKDLCLTIVNVLVEADTKKFSKIALPAISSGIYGVPRRLCAEMYIMGVIDYDSGNPQTQVRDVHFVDIKTDILQEIREAYGRWKQNDKSLDFKNANSYNSALGTPPRYRPVKQAPGSDQELGSDFVEGPEWERNDDHLTKGLPVPRPSDVRGTLMGQLTGNQPTGIMYHNVRKDLSLPGFERYDTVEIFYEFPDGIQGVDHPHPGKPFRGISRRAFVPDNPEGRKVLQLLKVAFDRKLIFTIARSLTGRKDVITWNGIEHKTSVKGGRSQYGYPDGAYLSRIQEMLALIGVTEKDIQDADLKWT